MNPVLLQMFTLSTSQFPVLRAPLGMRSSAKPSHGHLPEKQVPFVKTVWRLTRAFLAAAALLGTLCYGASAAYRMSVFAGPDGTLGSADGSVSSARFNQPLDVALDASGNLYVADSRNCTIRKVTPAGVVTTLADNSGIALSCGKPTGLAVDESGNLYVADESNNNLTVVTPELPIAPEERVAPKIAISGGNVMLTVRPAVAGRVYQLQCSDSMDPGSWQDLEAVWVGNGSELVITTPYSLAVARRFYRLALAGAPTLPEEEPR